MRRSLPKQTDQRDELAAGIRGVIHQAGSPQTIGLTIWQYIVASRPVAI
jgi:hypothetical protein